jgi:hypothetical protein
MNFTHPLWYFAIPFTFGTVVGLGSYPFHFLPLYS